MQRGKASAATKEDTIRQNAIKLQEVLKSFGVNVTMTNYSCGPSVTRYEMVPEQGVKVSKITGLADDIMMNLAAQSIRIEAPIPGKSAVGIEIPNGSRSGVGFRELIDTEKFIKHPSKISFAVGKDIEGNVVVEDIAKMPKYREQFDYGTARAVAKLNILAEYTVPFIKIGGTFVAYKGSDAENELNEAKSAISKLYLSTKNTISFELGENSRTIILFKKSKQTPNIYPRGQNKPRKNPL